ncbi:MAG: hypothetical protein NTX17_00245 [Candidatus Eisenbacteria bacterium]|nr:hypothetical protein [Candidatus Eisenbacteria bacterium]
MIFEQGRLEDFARRFLTQRGATVAPAGKDLLEVKLGPRLREKFKREGLLLAFSEEAATQVQEAELATPGSYIFSQLLFLAREKGVACRTVATEKTKSPTSFLKQMQFKDFGVEIVDRESYHHAFIRFHFLISYRSVDSTHEIRSVLYDTALKRVSPEADGSWERMQFESATPKGECLPSVGHEALAAALEETCSYLIARIKHKVFALKARSNGLLETELQRLESYYRQLIEEQHCPSAEAGEKNIETRERVENCKREWQRKASTEAIRFRPRVRFSLIGLEEICVPRSLLTLRVNAHPFTEFYGVFDHASGTAKGAFCQGCNELSMAMSLDGSGGVLCTNCAEIPASF